jgi:multiple antibiotic resistance protein
LHKIFTIVLDILRSILGDSISIFTIMNPLSAGAIMLTLVDEDTTKKEFDVVASKNSRAVFVSMVIIFLSGVYIFDFFGIRPDGLRVFGGIILLLMGFNMVQGHDKKVNHRSSEQTAAQLRNDISMVPLAIPIIVGPGLATTLINLSLTNEGWQSYVSVISAILICSVANYVILRNMPYIKKRLGVNGLKVFNRLMGLIVGSLAAQMLLNGMFGLYQSYFN